MNIENPKTDTHEILNFKRINRSFKMRTQKYVFNIIKKQEKIN